MKSIATFFAVLLLISLSSGSGAAPAAEAVWLESVDEAIAAAHRQGSLVFVDLYAEWCGWCRVLEEDVFPSPEFEAWAKDHVRLRVDTQDQGEGSAVQALYGVRKLPTVVVLNAGRVKVAELTGVFPPAEYVERLQAEVEKYERIVKFYNKVRDSDKTELQRELARDLHRRLDGLRAAGLYEKVLERSAADTEDAAWLSYYVADAYRLGGATEPARKYLERAQGMARRLDEADLLEQTGLLAYYIARGTGDCDGAQSALRDFLRDYPASENTPDVRHFLSEYRQGRVDGCQPSRHPTNAVERSR